MKITLTEEEYDLLITMLAEDHDCVPNGFNVTQVKKDGKSSYVLKLPEFVRPIDGTYGQKVYHVPVEELLSYAVSKAIARREPGSQGGVDELPEE